MTYRRLTILAAAAALLAGCMSVNVPEDAFFYPDTRLAAEQVTLPADIPMAFDSRSSACPTRAAPSALPGSAPAAPTRR